MNNQIIETCEQYVLSCMLHDADALATGCSKLLPDDFSNPTNVIIFNIIKGLHTSNKIIATAAILDVIKSTPKYAFTDAHIIVEQLYASFSHTLELETKLEMIKNNTCHNLLNKLCDKVKTDKFNIMNTDEELLKVRDELDQIMMRKSHASFTMVADTVAGLKKWEANALNNSENRIGVKTFIPQLDKFYHTMLPGQLHVLAGRPGSGKTAFAVDLAVKTARECKEYNDRQENDKKKKCVLIFSCEMTSEEIVSRMISNLSSVTYSQYEEDFKAIAARPEQFKLVNQSQKILSDYPIHIADQTFNIEDIVSGVREIAFTYDVELVVIDYIQKIRSNVLGGKTSLHEIINKTVTELKNIAKNKGTVVFALAQAQREIDSLTRGPGGANKPRASSEPDLGNIRDSSSIESEADTVSFIYQDTNGEEPNLGDSKEPVAIMKYNMKKNRNGTFGVARIEFDKKFSRFTAGDNNHNYAKD